MAESSVNMKFTAQTADAQKRIEELEKKVASLNKQTKETNSASKQATAGVDNFSLSALKGTAAVAGLTAAVVATVAAAKEMINAYAESERVTTRMTAVWQNVGKATGYSAQQVIDYAEAVEKTTYFEAEAVMSAAQLLAATEKLSDKGFQRALDISIDLAEAMGTDVPNAASMMSRALSDPETGLRALRTAGINFTDEEKELIKSLMDANKELDAQEIVLGKVEAAYKGVAASVKATDSGKLETIATQLGNIKKNLGSAILDEIQPALDAIIEKLGKIEEWSNKTKTQASIGSDVNSGMKAWELANKYTADELRAYKQTLTASVSNFGGGGIANIGKNELLDSAINIAATQERGRKKTELYQDYYIEPIVATNTEAVGSATEGGIEDAKDELEELNKFLNQNAKLSATAQVAAYDAQIQQAEAFKESGLAGEEEIKILDEIIAKLKEEKAAIENAGEATQDWGKDWKSLASLVGDFGSAATDMFVQMWDQEAEALEDELARQKEAGEITVEQETEKQKQINDLRKKAFVAEKANNIANALINGALAITQCLAQLGPIAGPIAAGIVGATTALQVATISSQQFTPMAKGGIVTQATPIIAGEAGPEAIIPLSGGRGKQYLEGNGGVTINITIQGNANTEDIYEAIERAQRTGLLPSWRYVQ